MDFYCLQKEAIESYVHCFNVFFEMVSEWAISRILYLTCHVSRFLVPFHTWYLYRLS